MFFKMLTLRVLDVPCKGSVASSVQNHPVLKGCSRMPAFADSASADRHTLRRYFQLFCFQKCSGNRKVGRWHRDPFRYLACLIQLKRMNASVVAADSRT